MNGIVGDQLERLDLWILQQFQQRTAEFLEIVRRNIGRHPDGNSRGAVDQQVGNSAGQNDRFLAAAVVVGFEGNRPCSQIFEDLSG